MRVPVDEIQADDRGIGDRCFPSENVLDLLDGSPVRPIEAASGNLHHDEECALVFFGQSPSASPCPAPRTPTIGPRPWTRPMIEMRTSRANHGAIGVAHMVDAAHDHADRAAAGP